MRRVQAPESTLSTGTYPQYTHLYGLSAEAAILYRSTQLRPHYEWAQLLLFCKDQGAPRLRLSVNSFLRRGGRSCTSLVCMQLSIKSIRIDQGALRPASISLGGSV